MIVTLLKDATIQGRKRLAGDVVDLAENALADAVETGVIDASILPGHKPRVRVIFLKGDILIGNRVYAAGEEGMVPQEKLDELVSNGFIDRSHAPHVKARKAASVSAKPPCAKIRSLKENLLAFDWQRKGRSLAVGEIFEVTEPVAALLVEEGSAELVSQETEGIRAETQSIKRRRANPMV